MDRNGCPGYIGITVRNPSEYSGVIEKVKELGKKYENINQTTVLDEINCSEKKWRMLSLNHYSKEGKIISSVSQEGQWDYIVPNSRVGALYKAVCK